MTCTYQIEQRHYVGQGCVMIPYLLGKGQMKKKVSLGEKKRNKKKGNMGGGGRIILTASQIPQRSQMG